MCHLYSARKKLIHAMSLDIDRPITRAVVVECAISATGNYLKLHMSRTFKSTVLGNPHAKTRKLWKRAAGLPPLEAIYPSINSAARPLLHFTRPPRCPTTLFGSPVCRHDVASHSRRAYHQERRRH